MCDLQKDVPDTSQAPPGATTQTQFPGVNTGNDQGTTTLATQGTAPGPQPTKKVPTKLGTFLKVAMPLLQGAAYGAGSAEPTRALGGAGFGPALAGGMARTQQMEYGRQVAAKQMALEQQDRLLKQMTLQNAINNEQSLRDYRTARIGQSATNEQDKLGGLADEWGSPVQTDQGLVQTSKSGKTRFVPMPGQDTGAAPTTAPEVSPSMPGVPGISMPALAAANSGAMGNTPQVAPPAASGTTAGKLTRTPKGTKGQPPEVKYDEGIPTGIIDKRDPNNPVTWDINDKNLPSEFSGIKNSAMAAHKQHVQEQKDINASSQSNRYRSMPREVLDLQNGGAPIYVQAGEAEDHPDRYRAMSYHDMMDLQGKVATINELDQNMGNVDKFADNVKGGGLDPNAVAAGLADPTTNLGKQFQGMVVQGKITPGQRDLLNSIRNLRSGMASYKNILSTGGVTDARVGLMEAELPGEAEIATGNPAIIRQKLNAVRQIYEGVRQPYVQFMNSAMGPMSGVKNGQPQGGKGKAYSPNNPFAGAAR